MDAFQYYRQRGENVKVTPYNYWYQYKPHDGGVMSWYSGRPLVKAKSSMIPTNQSTVEPRPNYSQPFFVTPASDYKALNPPQRGVLNFANSAGDVYRIKDYDYAVVQPKVGNPATVIYVNDPDVYVGRNETWFLTK